MPKRVERKVTITDGVLKKDLEDFLRAMHDAPARADIKIWINAYEGGPNFVDCDGDLKFEISWSDVEGGDE